MEVGIRELRADLSRWIRRVREGEEVIVTDRGRPVARLGPVEGERRIDRLIREGLVVPAAQLWRGPLPEPLEDAGPLSDLVLDGRE